MRRSLAALAALLVAFSALTVGRADAADAVITDFGVQAGESDRVQTVALQRAIDETSAGGGGRLTVPEGEFRTGALDLKAGVELHLAEGAVLLGSDDIADFPIRQTRIEGKVQPWVPAVLNAKGLSGVRVTGPGTLDGDGKPYWTAFWKRRAENRKCTNLEVHRPRLMYFESCDDVEVIDLNLRNSGFWNLHVYKCAGVRIEGVSIRAPHGDPPRITGDDQPWDEVSIDRAPSSDGIDVDSCQSVVIRDCVISVGDDCIALKGTKGPRAMEDEASPPVENILIEGCDFQSGHGVMTCGSEATIVRNVVVRDCKVGPGVPVCRLKLRPDTPQRYENLLFDGLTLDGAQSLFDVKPWRQFYDPQGMAPPKSEVRNVVLRNITGSLRSLGDLRGNRGDSIENVTLSNIELITDRGDLRVGEVVGLRYVGVVINGDEIEAPDSE
ncbi:Exo-poly-alpha-D-galacturonosidase precursor [Pseudobythopirellula maris]|uniref:Exo-poly-alpha-D-galacturonosidase n=1 Tax=Pseudobythopirellula maris TaxID=2527991 RepID=A0A5C5ZTV2_9BACT|nr:glycosyl hydrolase family 28 protein [Pseudobythopirellula maris]TWT90859.1 Exo-poly-alpha-D-galacturonosidase precursor [Pseudobythopirellula maris]